MADTGVLTELNFESRVLNDYAKLPSCITHFQLHGVADTDLWPNSFSFS